MSFLVKITIPISDYYGDSVFFKDLFFEVESKSPSKEQVIQTVESLIEQYKQYPEYYGEEDEVLSILHLIDGDDWQYVKPSGIVMTNTFVTHPKFKKQPVTWEVITPHKIA